MQLSETVEWGLHACLALAMMPDGARILVPKFVEAMRPYIDKTILQYQNQALPTGASKL